MSRIKTLVGMLAVSAVAFAGDVWMGDMDSIRFVSKIKAQKAEAIENGVRITAEPDVDAWPGRYVVFTMETVPFKLDDTSLVLDIQNKNLVAGHMFYIKCLNDKGEHVASFYTNNTFTSPSHLVLTPGRYFGGIQWFGADAKAPISDYIVALEFSEHFSENGKIDLEITNVGTGGPVPNMKPVDVKDYGFTVKGGTKRGVFATVDKDGSDALIVWLMDDLNRRNLQINIETGECTEVPIPSLNTPDAVYSSIMSTRNLNYSLVGRAFLEYNSKTRSFSACHNCPHPVAMAMAEGPDDKIWAISYPDAGLVSFDPETREFVDYGVVNKENWPQYSRSLVAHDDGWIYLSIGYTKAQIVAFHPEDRKIVPLLDGEDRLEATDYAINRFNDGNVYARRNNKWFKLEYGQITKLDKAPNAKAQVQRTGSQDYVYSIFPSGRKLKELNVVDKYVVTTDENGKDERKVEFEYEASHCGLMGLDVTEDGIVGGGGFFPFRFGTVDLETKERTDRQCDEQCNTIVACGKYFYIGGYCGGQLLRLDPRKPWNLKSPMGQKEPNFESNPIFYGKADPIVNRPHAVLVTPEQDYFVVGGTPEYGMTGGGLAIVDLKTNEVELVDHEKLVKHESPYSMAAVGDGILVVGTTVSAGTGGEVRAKGASLAVYDIKNKKVLYAQKFHRPVGCINSLIAIGNGHVLGLAGGELFEFDPKEFKIVKKGSVEGYGGFVGGQGPRIMHKDKDGNVYVAFNAGLAKLDLEKLCVADFMTVPGGIDVGGGIYQGRFFYASNKHWKSVDLSYFK